MFAKEKRLGTNKKEVIEMAKVRGTSNAPIVLGVVGGGLGLPASLCSGVCAASVEVMTETEGTGLTEFYLYGTAIVSIVLIVLACFTKKAPKIVGVLMILATLCGGILFGVTYNLLGIIAMIISLIGAVLSILQKKEVVE